ncbi:hypothetical protein NRK67_16935 (plasmid) [Fusobacteria bacterium ZRK30]|nr:hypothetical protein NRK67_16935 [Fusobacteria bacterium ZRK30]
MKKFIYIFISIILLLIGYHLYTIEFWEPKASYNGSEVISVAALQNNLEALKQELREKGEYRCCIQNDCAWCAIYMGHCICADLITVEGREQSCPECAAAWNKKRGKIPGVDSDAVEVITFGVYGFENNGEHYHPPVKGEVEDNHHKEEKQKVDIKKNSLSHDEVHNINAEHSH